MADDQGKYVYVKLPTGSYVKFPEGTSPQIMANVIKQQSRNIPPPAAGQPPKIPMEQGSSVPSKLVGAGQYLSDAWRQQQQMGKTVMGPRAAREALDERTVKRLTDAAQAGVGGEGLVGVGEQAGKAAVRAVGERAAQKFSALPIDQQARKLVQAVNPEPSEWRSFLRNMTQVGNVKEFAQRVGQKITTNLEFAKAARGAAEEAKTFYDKMLTPMRDEMMEIPRDSHVARIPTEGGTSSRATIGAVNDRITAINDMLRSAYGKAKAGGVREALADEATLKAEAKGLAERLYQELGNRMKINPDAIKGLRQRFGSLFDMADQIEGAVNRREAMTASRVEGRNLPHSVTQLGSRAYNALRGGPTAISDRAVARAVSRTSIPTVP